MALEAVVDVIEVVARFIGRFISEAIIEFMCKGAGYLICRIFKRNVDSEGVTVLIVGLIFWIAVGIISYQTYEALVQSVPS